MSKSIKDSPHPTTPTTTSIKTKIQELRKYLEHWNKRYFIENNPEVTDEEYDKKMAELIALERAHPEFTDPHSPSQKLGSTPLKSFQTLEHKIPMLSLSNIYSIADLELFDAQIRKQTKKAEISYTAEAKIDGISIAIRYERGLLKEALTRGDGQTGDDVTENIKTIRSIPLKLTEARTIEVRGEIFMPRTLFELLRKKQAQRGEKTFANTRNATAGSLKLLDSTKAAQRPLDAFFYQIAEGLTEDLPATQHERLQLIHNLGLKTNPHNTRIESLSALIEHIQQFRTKIPQLDYDIDGIVIKVDSIEDQEFLGNTAKEPKWAIAYKYPSKQMSTQILSIELSVGRHGTITPIAKFQSITLNGTEVSRASLHNFTQIKQKDIRIGDWVFIEKGGEIIPQVVHVITSKRPSSSTEYRFPRVCPSCAKPLTEERELYRTCPNPECKNQSRWSPQNKTEECPSCGSKTQTSEYLQIFCDNSKCPEQRIKKITHFCSKRGLDITGFGESTIRHLFTEGFLEEISDLYFLERHRHRLQKQKGFGAKSIKKLLQAIESSKECSLHDFIEALGVAHLGKEASQQLSQRLHTVDALKNITAHKAKLQDFGPITQASILNYFSLEETQTLIQKLQEAGLQIKSTKSTNVRSPQIHGKRFTFTGQLKSHTRAQAIAKIESHGGKHLSQISPRTQILIIGEATGQKRKKAEELKIRIWTEADFLAALSTETQKAQESSTDHS